MREQERADIQPSEPAAAPPPRPATATAVADGPAPASTALSPRILGAGGTLLAAADTALSHLLVLPASLLQHARYLHASQRRGGAATPTAVATAGPRTPQAAAISPGSQRAGGSAGGTVYGLGIGELRAGAAEPCRAASPVTLSSASHARSRVGGSA